MGLKVIGSFTTAEGIPYTSVYVKLHTVICEFCHDTGETVNVSAHFLVFLNRERRDLGLSYAMPSPPFERILGYTTTREELSGAFLAGLYARYTAYLTERGYSVEDVIEASQQSSESTQTTPPTPPQPEAPQES